MFYDIANVNMYLKVDEMGQYISGVSVIDTHICIIYNYAICFVYYVIVIHVFYNCYLNYVM